MPSRSPSLSVTPIGHRQDYHEAFGRLDIFDSNLSQLASERLSSATTFLHLLSHKKVLVFIEAEEMHVDGIRSAF